MGKQELYPERGRDDERALAGTRTAAVQGASQGDAFLGIRKPTTNGGRLYFKMELELVPMDDKYNTT